MAKQYLCKKDTFWNGALRFEGEVIESDKDLSKFRNTFVCLTLTSAKPVSKKVVAETSKDAEDTIM